MSFRSIGQGEGLFGHLDVRWPFAFHSRLDQPLVEGSRGAGIARLAWPVGSGGGGIPSAGFAVDRRAPAWGQQYQDIGFSQTDQAAARRAYAAWEQRMETSPPASDCAADALESEGEWNAYLQAISGFMNGAGLEHISVADYTAYDAASTGYN